MATIAQQHQADEAQHVVGGVDTHRDTHTAAVIDLAGRVLGSAQFPATVVGYRALLAWMAGFGMLTGVGVEGTGVYGSGLARYLRRQGVEMVEVDRPDRKARRWHGKSDPVDAEAAARTALAGVRTGTPKDRDGQVEALRNLRVARRSAVEQRASVQTRIKSLLVTAPEPLRATLRALPLREPLDTCAALRPDHGRIGEPGQAAKVAPHPWPGATARSPRRSSSSTPSAPRWSRRSIPGSKNSLGPVLTSPASCS